MNDAEVKVLASRLCRLEDAIEELELNGYQVIRPAKEPRLIELLTTADRAVLRSMGVKL
jgi:hypothetical protein